MSYWYAIPKEEYQLYHHGIIGQRWGIRRFQPYAKGEKVGQATKVEQRSKGTSSQVEQSEHVIGNQPRYNKKAKMKDRIEDLRTSYTENTGQKATRSQAKYAIKSYDNGRRLLEKQLNKFKDSPKKEDQIYVEGLRITLKEDPEYIEKLGRSSEDAKRFLKWGIPFMAWATWETLIKP